MKGPIKRKKPNYKYNTVLLIDDNELDNFINQKIIESNFFAKTIYINTNGISALELLKNFSINSKLSKSLIPDVIFIDINMPFMDGFQLIENILQFPEQIIKKCKLVVLTSSINPEDRIKISTLSPKILFVNKPLTDQALSLI